MYILLILRSKNPTLLTIAAAMSTFWRSVRDRRRRFIRQLNRVQLTPTVQLPTSPLSTA